MSFHFVGLWSRAAVQYFPELLHVVCGPIPHLLHIKQILLWLRYFSSSCFYLLLYCSITTVDVCLKTGWIYLPNAPTRLKHAVIPSLFHRQGAEAQNCIYRPNGKSVLDKATAQGSKIPAFCMNSFFFFIPWLLHPAQILSGKSRHEPHLWKPWATISENGLFWWWIHPAEPKQETQQ